MTDVVYDFSRTELVPLGDVTLTELEDWFRALEAEADDTLAEEGFDAPDRHTERSVEMRYLGQEHTVEVSASELSTIDELADRFANQHHRRYGHTMDDPVEAVHLRVRGVGETEKPEINHMDHENSADPYIDSQEAYCFATEEMTDFAVYRRSGLDQGRTIDGPAIVREPTTTVVFHSDQRATVDEYGNLVIAEGDQ
jgi:N-methylhydantoinase A